VLQHTVASATFGASRPRSRLTVALCAFKAVDWATTPLPPAGLDPTTMLDATGPLIER
jgi:hypothetical protein